MTAYTAHILYTFPAMRYKAVFCYDGEPTSQVIYDFDLVELKWAVVSSLQLEFNASDSAEDVAPVQWYSKSDALDHQAQTV